MTFEKFRIIWRDNIKVLYDCLYNIHFFLGKLHYILAIELLPSFIWGERSPQGPIHIGKNKDVASNFVSKLGNYFSRVLPGPKLIPYPISIPYSRVLKYRFDTHAIVAFLNVLNTALLRRTEVFSCFFLSIVIRCIIELCSN